MRRPWCWAGSSSGRRSVRAGMTRASDARTRSGPPGKVHFYPVAPRANEKGRCPLNVAPFRQIWCARAWVRAVSVPLNPRAMAAAGEAAEAAEAKALVTTRPDLLPIASCQHPRQMDRRCPNQTFCPCLRPTRLRRRNLRPERHPPGLARKQLRSATARSKGSGRSKRVLLPRRLRWKPSARRF